MSVGIVILNWNGWEDTVECLDTVLGMGGVDFRVVVCDNASADGSLDRIAEWADGRVRYRRYDRAEAERGGRGDEPPLVLVQTGANLGFAGGNNVGILHLLADPSIRYLWLLNNDTVVEARSLSALVELAEARPDAGMIGSKLLYYDEPEKIQAIAGGRVIPWQGTTRHLGRDERDRGQWEEPITVDYVTGSSLLVRAEVVREIGLMEEGYFLYSEEVDWCLRARRAGWTLLYCPGSRVWHKEGRSVGPRSAVGDYYHTRSVLLLTRAFYPALLPSVFLYSLYRCLLPKVLRRDPVRLRAVLRAYRDFATSRPHSPPTEPAAEGGSPAAGPGRPPGSQVSQVSQVSQRRSARAGSAPGPGSTPPGALRSPATRTADRPRMPDLPNG